MDALLRAAGNLAPASSKRKPRLPYTPSVLKTVHTHLHLSDPFDAAVWACLLCAFWSATRLGELTVKNLADFKPHIHTKRSDVRLEHCEWNGLRQTACFIPRTKTARTGEDNFWSQQPGILDADNALQHHLKVNPGADSPLFAYRHKQTLRPLTKSAFFQLYLNLGRGGSVEGNPNPSWADVSHKSVTKRGRGKHDEKHRYPSLCSLEDLLHKGGGPVLVIKAMYNVRPIASDVPWLNIICSTSLPRHPKMQAKRPLLKFL